MKEKRNYISKDFSERLKQLRLERNWSQGQVAKKANIDSQRISKYERGILFPTVDVIIRLAAAFEVSLDYLLLEGVKQEVETQISQIKNQELLERFRQIEELPEEEQKAVGLLLAAVIKQHGLRKLNEMRVLKTS